jgi:hypothetical protein
VRALPGEPLERRLPEAEVRSPHVTRAAVGALHKDRFYHLRAAGRSRRENGF